MGLRAQASNLAVLHAADVLQPLLLLPYAARVLGPEHFGQYAYALSIGQIASTVVDYGFHWTAQREAASARHEPATLAAILAEVCVTKMVLLLVVTLVGLAAADSFLALSKPMFLSVMLISVGSIMFPAWLFIGLERAWQAAIGVVVARVLALIAFFAMVKSPGQLDIAVATQAAIPLISGVVTLPFLVAFGLGGFRSVSLSRIAAQLRNGWRGFLFTFVERALMTLPVPLVEHFGGYAAAGQYSIAEKFVSATRPFFRVMSETFLPRVAFYARHDPAAGIALVWRSLSTLIVGASLSLFLYFFAPYLILHLFGSGYSDAIPIVRTMAVLPVLMNANICTSNLYMFNFGHERAWAILTVIGLAVFLALAYILSRHMLNPSIGVVAAIIARESVVLVVSAAFFLKFAAGRARTPSPQSVAEALPSVAATRSLRASAVLLAPRWGGQPRSER
ncbi:MAG TPA: oligosaccharide flippase family protein [Roseiarcus sp.]|jgi:O-antigen/teichoic acid export membrane protein